MHTTGQVTDYQQALWSDPSDVRLAINPGSTEHPYLLMSVGVDPAGGESGPTAGPLTYVFCDEPRTQVVSAQALSMAPTASSSENEQAASLFQALQHCMQVISGELEVLPGTPWWGIDGTGTHSVSLVYREDDNTPYYLPSDRTLRFSPHDGVSSDDYLGASLEVVCHELAHAIWNSIYSDLEAEQVQTLEGRALNEGFADILGSAVEMLVRAPSPPWNSRAGRLLLRRRSFAQPGVPA